MSRPRPEQTPREPPELVEHFFRHESAKLVAVLTRAFGVHYLELVEDTVQEALLTAVQSWGRRGVPDNPSGWIYRVARNRILDALRRERIHRRALALAGGTDEAMGSLVEDWLTEEQLPDSLLRMIFVCCHPALDRRSQIALTLKILCGFSLVEIARGLLISTEAAKKRVQRARKILAREQIRVDLPTDDQLEQRLAAVHTVLYLMFNEGYSTSKGPEPLRDDICEEAARLCHLLCDHDRLGTADAQALLALMLAQSARMPARVDSEGAVVLLADQDRSRWDRRLIYHAEYRLDRSRTERPSRFHYEAAIALTHCRAESVAATDWVLIVRYYDRLLALGSSAIYALNRAIAQGEAGHREAAMSELLALRAHPDLRGYFLLDCAVARLHELSGEVEPAAAAYGAALRADVADHERVLIEKKLARLNGLDG